MRTDKQGWRRWLTQETIGIATAAGAVVAALLLSSCGGGGGGGGGGSDDGGGGGESTVLDLALGTQSVSGELAGGSTREFTVQNAGIDITMMLFGLTGTAKMEVFSDAGFNTPLACASGHPDPESEDHFGGHPADCNLGAQAGDFYVRLTAVEATPYVFTVAIPGAAVGTTCFGDPCIHQGSSETPATLELEPGNDVVTGVGQNSSGDGGSFFHIAGLTPDTHYALALGGIAVSTEATGFSYYASSDFEAPPEDCNLIEGGGPGQPMSCFPRANGAGEMWLYVNGTSDEASGTAIVLFLAEKADSILFPD